MIRFANEMCKSYSNLLVAMIEGFKFEFNEFSILGENDELESHGKIRKLFGSNETVNIALDKLIEILKSDELYNVSEYYYYLLYHVIEDVSISINDSIRKFVDVVIPSEEARLLKDKIIDFAPNIKEIINFDFDLFIGTFFWDEDFLLDASFFNQQSEELKDHMRYSESTFSVVNGLLPNSEDLTPVLYE